MANPALGHRITVENIRDASIFNSKDAFKTETLCMWVDALDSPWPMDMWNAGEKDVSLEDGLPTYMALDLSFNRELACLVTIQERPEGMAVFLHEWQKDGGINDLELTGEIAKLTRRYNPRSLPMIQILLATLRQGWHKLAWLPSRHHGHLLALALCAIRH